MLLLGPCWMQQPGATRAFHSTWLVEYLSYIYFYYLFLFFLLFITVLFLILLLYFACHASVIFSVVAYSLIEDVWLSVNIHRILGETVLGMLFPTLSCGSPLLHAEQHLSSGSKCLLL